MINEILEVMADILQRISEPYGAIIEIIIGKKKENPKTPLKEKVDLLINSLQESQTIIDELHNEMQLKQDTFLKLKSDVEELEELSKVKEAQSKAIINQLRNFERSGKKRSALINITINFIFLLLGALINFLITKYLF